MPYRAGERGELVNVNLVLENHTERPKMNGAEPMNCPMFSCFYARIENGAPPKLMIN